MSDFYLTLNVDKQGVPLQVVRARAGDIGTPLLHVTILNGRNYFDFDDLGSNVTSRFMCKKPNGEIVVEKFDRTGTSSSFNYRLPPAAIGVSGTIELAYFSFTTPGGYTETTEAFTIIVESGLELPLPDSYIKEIDTVVEQMSAFLRDNTELHLRMSNDEEIRVSHETARIAAENNRISAENARVTAETKRATDTASAISNCNTAKTAADTAAQNANSAKAATEQATSNANTAATSANNAATAATTAAQNANEAAQEARDAIENMGSGGGSNIEFVDDATAVQALREMLGGA